MREESKSIPYIPELERHVVCLLGRYVRECNYLKSQRQQQDKFIVCTPPSQEEITLRDVISDLYDIVRHSSLLKNFDWGQIKTQAFVDPTPTHVKKSMSDGTKTFLTCSIFIAILSVYGVCIWLSGVHNGITAADMHELVDFIFTHIQH